MAASGDAVALTMGASIRMTRAATMQKFAVLMVLGIWATGSASGTTITVDGDLSDWGVTASTVVDRADTAWAPTMADWTTSWWAEDTTDWNSRGDGSVGPGYGGQNFDVEAAYMTSANSVLYGAFVSGFDRAGQSGWNGSGWYSTGDLFFDLGGNGTWDFAIALSTHDGFLEGCAYIPSSAGTWYTTPTDFAASAPAQLLSGVTFTELSGVQYAYHEGTSSEKPYASEKTSDYSGADHNIVEFSLDDVDLHYAFPSLFSGTSVVMHYTQTCGNDVLDLPGIVVYTPEPATAALLALGVVAAYARRRRTA